MKVDSINYRLYSKNLNTNSSLNGYSGSPVFLQDLESKKWRIAGVFVGSGEDANHENFLYIVKIDLVLKKIRELN